MLSSEFAITQGVLMTSPTTTAVVLQMQVPISLLCDVFVTGDANSGGEFGGGVGVGQWIGSGLIVAAALAINYGK